MHGAWGSLAGKGGSGPYRKGAAHERLVKKAYEAHGYFVVRSPQSGSPIDLTCVDPCGNVSFVQCKLRGYMRPAEKQEVIELARRHYAYPILAWGTGPIYRLALVSG